MPWDTYSTDSTHGIYVRCVTCNTFAYCRLSNSHWLWLDKMSREQQARAAAAGAHFSSGGSMWTSPPPPSLPGPSSASSFAGPPPPKRSTTDNDDDDEQFEEDNPEDDMMSVASAASASNKSPTKPKRKRPKFIRKVTCQVCGDVANDHIHYGAIACYSCRAFFRRGVNTNAPYYCSQNKQCPITKCVHKIASLHSRLVI